MKLNKRNTPHLYRLILLCALLGTLFWTLILQILPLGPTVIAQSHVGPLTLDLYTVTLSLRLNPGTLAGAVSGGFLFKALP